MQKITLSSELVKGIALVSMTLDHTVKIFNWSEMWSNTLGRFAFPIFAYLIIHNFYLYHPVKKYLIRLGFFAVITSLILNFFTSDVHNVLLTFFCGIFFLSITEYICSKTNSFFWQFYWVGLVFLILFPFILKADYSLMGFLLLLAFYAYERKPILLNYFTILVCGATCNFSGVIPVMVTLFTLILLLSVFQISGGKRLIRWWGFYIYYPLHKLLLYSLKILLGA